MLRHRSQRRRLGLDLTLPGKDAGVLGADRRPRHHECNLKGRPPLRSVYTHRKIGKSTLSKGPKGTPFAIFQLTRSSSHRGHPSAYRVSKRTGYNKDNPIGLLPSQILHTTIADPKVPAHCIGSPVFSPNECRLTAIEASILPAKPTRAFMNNQEPDLNPTPIETDSAKTNEPVQREESELPVDQRSS